MITKFKIFEKNNYNPPKELLYDEARDLSKKRERINYYFYSNYEEGFDKIIGKLGIKVLQYDPTTNEINQETTNVDSSNNVNQTNWFNNVNTNNTITNIHKNYNLLNRI